MLHALPESVTKRLEASEVNPRVPQGRGHSMHGETLINRVTHERVRTFGKIVRPIFARLLD